MKFGTEQGGRSMGNQTFHRGERCGDTEPRDALSVRRAAFRASRGRRKPAAPWLVAATVATACVLLVGAVPGASAHQGRRILLTAHGVDAVRFGEPKATAVKAFQALFGKPTSMTGNPGCGTTFSEANWGELAAEFHHGVFSGYRYLNRPDTDPALAPHWQLLRSHPVLATERGITLGNSLAQLRRAYGRLAVTGANRYRAADGITFVDNSSRSPAPVSAQIIEIKLHACGNY
jgi:hypothetical protein